MQHSGVGHNTLHTRDRAEDHTHLPHLTRLLLQTALIEESGAYLVSHGPPHSRTSSPYSHCSVSRLTPLFAIRENYVWHVVRRHQTYILCVGNIGFRSINVLLHHGNDCDMRGTSASNVTCTSINVLHVVGDTKRQQQAVQVQVLERFEVRRDHCE